MQLEISRRKNLLAKPFLKKLALKLYSKIMCNGLQPALNQGLAGMGFARFVTGPRTAGSRGPGRSNEKKLMKNLLSTGHVLARRSRVVYNPAKHKICASLRVGKHSAN